MTGLVLIRHAAPVRRPETPSSEWQLGPEGRAAAGALASRIDVESPARVATSDEPKAVATAEPIAAALGATLQADRRLREADRPYVDDDYEGLATDWLRGVAVPGWEVRAAVVDRMAAAVADALAPPGGTSLVVGHGLAIATYLQAATGIDPAEFWRGLRMPDAWFVDLVARSASRCA